MSIDTKCMPIKRSSVTTTMAKRVNVSKEYDRTRFVHPFAIRDHLISVISQKRQIYQNASRFDSTQCNVSSKYALFAIKNMRLITDHPKIHLPNRLENFFRGKWIWKF